MNTLENTTTAQSYPHHASRTAKVKSFVWHLIQMIVAMEIGMMLYMLFVNQLAPTSYRTSIVDYPIFGYWIMMIAMTAPMIVLMRYHKYAWRCCIEMTSTMLAPVALLTALTLFSAISFQIFHSVGGILMNLGMVVYMIVLYRRE